MKYKDNERDCLLRGNIVKCVLGLSVLLVGYQSLEVCSCEAF
jgi:hypothetical protein